MKYLKKWRLAHGFTQAELARRAGVRRATISDMESGSYNHEPKPSTSAALALGLGITNDELLGVDPFEMIRHKAGWYKRMDTLFHFFDNNNPYAVCGRMYWTVGMVLSRGPRSTVRCLLCSRMTR